jgi:HEAT repeat protein
VTPNGNTAQSGGPPKKRPSNFWLILVAAIFIIVPFLTWYVTWFGRSLSDDKIAEYLSDEKNPRHIQHALTQIEGRMEKGDPAIKKFYPRIVELAKSPTGEVRKTTAWVMGQDNTSEEFHRALLELLKDTEPLVRRNAALQLVRFGDASGRPELRTMLQSFEAKAPFAGTIVSLLPVGSSVRAGSLLARLRDGSGAVQEFRAPVDGTIVTPVVAKEGDSVAANQTIAWLAPDRASISAALRALAYVGTKDDLPLVESCAQADGSRTTADQAALTSKLIRQRVSQSP